LSGSNSRAAFPVPDAALEALFTAVDTQVGATGCNHTLRFTEQWLAEHQQPMPAGWTG